MRQGDTANNAIKITIENDSSFEIDKIVIQCGKIKKEYTENPFIVSFSKEETELLSEINTLYIAVYNAEGEKKTINGQITFKADRKVVND